MIEHMLSDDALARGDLEGAERCLMTAIQRRPKDVNSHHKLATLLARTGRLDEAIERIRFAAALPCYQPPLFAWTAHLIMPAWLGPRWPWPVDVFHAQLYSVAFLTPAVAALCLRRATTGIDWWTQGTTQLAWGLLPLVGLVLADAGAKRVDWTGAATLLWLAGYAGLACVGAAMVLEARRCGNASMQPSP
jgi:hypothetical protein